MRTRDLMTTPVDTIPPVASVAEAAQEMQRTGVGCLVVADPQVRGILTDRDTVLRCVAANCSPESTLVRDVMTDEVVTLGPDDEVDAVFACFSDHAFRRIPIVDERGVAVGIVALDDVMLRGQSLLADMLRPVSREATIPRTRTSYAG
ncbi:CBS domain-containing protein [Streptomonospora nanhaiensis]|uniref:CBS domain-containing protein n=1 Tax=Streptomonospora nanhaiensis TaxID=1323731 RepID=A0A853BKN6_9ACTN|nr:CBS domain-containing protein [Streptomonospora nanhaiensis]MBV2364142.1 CBS domain-containing protein [Streptomonospora nanhaiensis]MBX9389463.1 CBS domain-containing protein [Streptomonospora nanhaiensis]NYI95092.1 CBS domain-containing protein [Streptomonospora nanhaiensis]